jgi:hypothetical protein
MKKRLLNHFILIIALHGMSSDWAMMKTTRRIPISSKKLLQPVYHTQPHQPRTWKESIQQSYNRFKELLWGPSKPKSEVFDETQKKVAIILNKFNSKDPNFQQELKTFLQESNQEEVNTFLDKFIFSGGLTELNERVFWLWDNDKIILKKITHWAKDNITQLFILNLPTDNEEFFLYTLLRRFRDKGLIKAIKNNFTSINQRPAGKKFISLLRKENIPLYNAIIPDNEKVLSEIKKSLTEENVPTNRE